MSKAALDSLIAAEAKGDKVIKSYVVLKDAKKRAVVGSLAAREVRNNLRDAGAVDGHYGSYWWINFAFKPAGGNVADDDIPF